MIRTSWQALRVISLTLLAAGGSLPTIASADPSQVTPPADSYTFRPNERARAVSTDGGPVLAFKKTEDYCKYVRVLLENAGEPSLSPTRLADGYASKLQSRSPVTVLGPKAKAQDCDGARVDFIQVKAKSTQPVYILRSYVKPVNAS